METTKYHPILFSTSMVQAILRGRKTQTRRVIKLPNYHPSLLEKQIPKLVIKDWILYDGNNENIGTLKSPYNVGDILWVKETYIPKYYTTGKNLYRADDNNIIDASRNLGHDFGSKWTPSIFMKKVDSRLFLKIKSIKVEKLQDISEEDSIQEGVSINYDGYFKNYFTKKGLRDEDGVKCLLAKGSFQSLWYSINGMESWEKNPFVFVYEFEKIEKPNNFI